MARLPFSIALVLFVSLGGMIAAAGEPAKIVLASTTSTQNTGLFEVLLPAFTKETGIAVAVVAVGTGQALEMARRGDADVLLVHDPEAEAKFLADGYGLERRQVMYNDFLIVGPAADPANIKGRQEALAAFKQLAAQGFHFVSRGDRSGTHAQELRLWQQAGVKPPGPPNYLEAGQGMEATLRLADEKQFYTLCDRATWLAAQQRRQTDLVVMVEGDPLLFNQYSVIVVNPAKHPHSKVKEAQALADWLVSPKGQKLIGEFKDKRGHQLFKPNAQPTS